MTTETTPSETIAPKATREDSKNRCPECGSERFERNSAQGEVYCLDCGRVIDEDKIDTSREYRAFDASDKNKKRVGSSISYAKAGKGMKTKIGESYELNKVSSKKRGQYYRMKKWDSRADSRESSINKGLSTIDRLTYELNLPNSITEEAGRLYEKCVDEDIIKGKKIEAAVAALIYLVVRNQEVPRTQKEITEAADVKQRKMNTTYRSIARDLDLDIKPARPENFIPRYASQLGLSGRAEARARNIVIEAREKGFTSGKNPSSVSAAGIYIGALLEGEEVTQKAVAETADITSTTVRKTYHQLAEGLGLEDQIEQVKS